MEQQFKVLDDVLLVSLTGELDLHTSKPMKDSIDNYLKENPKIKNILMDLEYVDFIDSTGLVVIIGRYRAIQERGGKLIFVKASPRVKRLLEISGVERIASFVDSTNEALLKLGRDSSGR
ncbi:MAG: anti-sigma factor antagonist [Firmicutes bacterium]|nr:anti-sigma factor antagonist [Bacillota bacterium]